MPSSTNQRVHRASGSIGPGFMAVVVASVDHITGTAICRDARNYAYQIRTDLVPSKTDQPEAGEQWIITKAYGDWVFSHVLTGTVDKTSLGGRRTAVYQTRDLAAGATELGLIRLSSDYRILYIKTSDPARVRLYVTEADRATDLDRGPTTEPQPGLGIVMDFITADVLLEAPLSPVPEGATFSDPLSKDIPISVTSVNGGPIVVTLTWVAEE